MNDEIHTSDDVEREAVSISTPYIELYKLLKRENLAASGGEAKYLVAEGYVLVNGEKETRKRKKIIPGDVVFCNGVELTVTAEE